MRRGASWGTIWVMMFLVLSPELHSCAAAAAGGDKATTDLAGEGMGWEAEGNGTEAPRTSDYSGFSPFTPYLMMVVSAGMIWFNARQRDLNSKGADDDAASGNGTGNSSVASNGTANSSAASAANSTASTADTHSEGPFEEIKTGVGLSYLALLLITLYLTQVMVRMTRGRLQMQVNARSRDVFEYSAFAITVAILVEALLSVPDYRSFRMYLIGDVVAVAFILTSILLSVRHFLSKPGKKPHDAKWFLMTLGFNWHLLCYALFTPVYYEHRAHDFAGIATPADAAYFAAIVATSTGYGDILPITEVGKTIVTSHTMYGFFMKVALGNAMFLHTDNEFKKLEPEKAEAQRRTNVKQLFATFIMSTLAVAGSTFVESTGIAGNAVAKGVIFVAMACVYLCFFRWSFYLTTRRLRENRKVEGDLFTAAVYQFALIFASLGLFITEWSTKHAYFKCQVGVACPVWWQEVPIVSIVITLATYFILVRTILVAFYNDKRGPQRDGEFFGVIVIPLVHSIILLVNAGLIYVGIENYDGVNTYLDSIYLAAVTHTSLGFGDVVISGNTARMQAGSHTMLAFFLDIMSGYLLMDD